MSKRTGRSVVNDGDTLLLMKATFIFSSSSSYYSEASKVAEIVIVIESGVAVK